MGPTSQLSLHKLSNSTRRVIMCAEHYCHLRALGRTAGFFSFRRLNPLWSCLGCDLLQQAMKTTGQYGLFLLEAGYIF